MAGLRQGVEFGDGLHAVPVRQAQQLRFDQAQPVAQKQAQAFSLQVLRRELQFQGNVCVHHIRVPQIEARLRALYLRRLA
jgi:hypothetical protein